MVLPQHRVRLVGLVFEELDLFGAQLDLGGCHRLFDMSDLTVAPTMGAANPD